jgi:hypothetical protein
VTKEGSTDPLRSAWLDGAKHAVETLIETFREVRPVPAPEPAGAAPGFAPHLSDMKGDVLRRHLQDAHFKDPALLGDAKDATLISTHVTAHNANAAESKTEAVLVDEVLFSEKAVSRDGVMRVKVIAPGWGSSGYYGEEMLRRDGPTVFPKGTKMYADHPTASGEKDLPERSIKDIAATTTEPVTWENDARHGPGLYAKAKVIDTWKPAIEALSGTIGCSIRALGVGKQGEVEGRKGTIVERLTQGRSIDFVTEAGAGGKPISLAESARSRATEGNDMADEKELTEARAELAEEKKLRARAEERLVIREARDHVTALVAKAKVPDLTKQRIIDTASVNPPTKDGALDKVALDETVAKVVKDEAAYIAALTGSGQVKGMGGKGEDQTAEVTKGLVEAFVAMGHTEAEAKIMAAGRN